jgi:hypothetical protein
LEFCLNAKKIHEFDKKNTENGKIGPPARHVVYSPRSYGYRQGDTQPAFWPIRQKTRWFERILKENYIQPDTLYVKNVVYLER